MSGIFSTIWAWLNNEVLITGTPTELDTEGTIPPDDDPPQEMGDRSIEVTEDMRDKAQEERQQGSMAMAEGQCTNVLQPLTYLQ